VTRLVGWQEGRPACETSATTIPKSLLLVTGLTWSNLTWSKLTWRNLTWSNLTWSNSGKMCRLNVNWLCVCACVFMCEVYDCPCHELQYYMNCARMTEVCFFLRLIICVVHSACETWLICSSQDAEIASQASSGKRKLEPVPSSYHKKYEHLLGREAAKDAARATDANKSYGFGTSSEPVFWLLICCR